MSVIEEVRTVTSNGRMVVPWTIQQALGLEQGGPVCFRVENGIVTIHAAEDRWGEAAFASLLDSPPDERSDSLTALGAELESLLGVSERDHDRMERHARPRAQRAPLW